MVTKNYFPTEGSTWGLPVEVGGIVSHKIPKTERLKEQTFVFPQF